METGLEYRKEAAKEREEDGGMFVIIVWETSYKRLADFLNYM